ncbi:MAG: hypothetical protein WCK67_01205 [bacterium]
MNKLWQIDFSDEYLTNIEIIDDGHKKVAEMANRLFEMSADINTKESDLIAEIEETKGVILKHFEDEITIYKQHGLPDVEKHVIQHKVMSDYLNDLDLNNYPVVVKALMTNQLVLHYLMKHLFFDDKKCIKQLKDIV